MAFHALLPQRESFFLQKKMEIVMHAASVHVLPASRVRHERLRAILDGAGVAYTVNDTLDVARQNEHAAAHAAQHAAAQLPQLAVRRPVLDVVFASYDTLVEWNDAGTLVAQIEATVARAMGAGDKEIFKENMRLRATRRVTSDVAVQTDAQASEAREKDAPAAREKELRFLASEAIESSCAAEREAETMRAKAAASRAALCKMMSVVPTLLEVAAVLAEP
jgi:hypothetical protein